MNSPSFYISEENFQELIGPGFWSIQDLPAQRAEKVKPFLNNADTIGVFASGIVPQANLQGLDSIGGIDWVRLENRRQSGEPLLNVYHFIIMNPINGLHPVYATTPDGSIAPHWSELPDLDPYFE